MKRLWSRTCFALAVVAALFVLAPAGAEAKVDFNVKGRWTCKDPATGIKPISTARVELWRSRDYYFDEKITSRHLSADGTYDFKVTASGNFDLYVKLLLINDDGVELENWYSPFTWEHLTGTKRSHSGTVDLGEYQLFKNGSGSPKCAIWQGARNAYAAYQAVIGTRPPSSNYKIDAEFPCCGTPFTTRDTTRWPEGYTVGANGSVSSHEFGHSVRHSFDGGFSHFLLDVGRFQYPQTHQPCKRTSAGFAFNEGWAEYWSDDVPATACGGNRGDTVYEGNVAYALKQLEKCSDRPSMIRVLRVSPGAIHSFAEFEGRWRTVLAKGLCTAGLAPTGTGTSGPVLTGPQLAGGVLEQIAAQKKVIASLKRQAAGARGRAADPGRCTKGGCQVALQRLIAPSGLSVRAKQAQLVLDRLELGLAAARQAQFDPASQEKLVSGLLAKRDDFEKANQQIVIAGLKDSLGDIRREPGFKRARSTDLFKTLDRRMDALVRARRKGQATPAGLDSLFAAPDSPLDAAKKVR